MIIILAALLLASCVANYHYSMSLKNREETIDRLIHVLEEAVEEE